MTIFMSTRFGGKNLYWDWSYRNSFGGRIYAFLAIFCGGQESKNIGWKVLSDEEEKRRKSSVKAASRAVVVKVKNAKNGFWSRSSTCFSSVCKEFWKLEKASWEISFKDANCRVLKYMNDNCWHTWNKKLAFKNLSRQSEYFLQCCVRDFAGVADAYPANTKLHHHEG